MRGQEELSLEFHIMEGLPAGSQMIPFLYIPHLKIIFKLFGAVNNINNHKNSQNSDIAIDIFLYSDRMA